MNSANAVKLPRRQKYYAFVRTLPRKEEEFSYNQFIMEIQRNFQWKNDLKGFENVYYFR